MIPLAKVTLLPRHKQQGPRPVSSFVFQGITFVAGETQEVSNQIGVMYMSDPNFLVEFVENDFTNLEEELEERMSKRLNVPVKDIRKTVLPKKAVTTKVKETVKTTLSGVKPKKAEPVAEVVDEAPVVEEESSEETPSDE